MRILVTGGAGYIGSVLIETLLARGHEVVCLDRFFFGKESLAYLSANPALKLVKDDIRWFDSSLLQEVEAVFDLAALSNDPSGELDPARTLEINHAGRARVARLSKKSGVKRYVLASSCSIYGFNDKEVLTEESPTNPLTTYASANLKAEEEVLPLSDSAFCVTVARQATVYGLSTRMRFDLAINGMILGLFKNGKIPVLRDGTQWRPFVHVRDTSRALSMIVESDQGKVGGEIFNIGSDEQNVQILPLAKAVSEAVLLPDATEWYGSPDTRSYRVDFGKVRRVLGFQPEYTPARGATEVYDALKLGIVTDSAKTRTVEWYKYLLSTQLMLNEIVINNKIL